MVEWRTSVPVVHHIGEIGKARCRVTEFQVVFVVVVHHPRDVGMSAPLGKAHCQVAKPSSGASHWGNGKACRVMKFK